MFRAILLLNTLQESGAIIKIRQSLFIRGFSGSSYSKVVTAVAIAGLIGREDIPLHP